MLTGIDARTLSFNQPFYLWLLVIPGILTVLWAWRVIRRRVDVRRYRHEQVLPARDRYSLFGELAFWLGPMMAASLCIGARAAAGAGHRAGENGRRHRHLQDGSRRCMSRTSSRPLAPIRSVLWTFQCAGVEERRLSRWRCSPARAPPDASRDPNAFFFLDHLVKLPFGSKNDPTRHPTSRKAVLGLSCWTG